MSLKWTLGIWIVAIALAVAATAALRRRREPPSESGRAEMKASAEAARDLKRIDELKVRRDELDRTEAVEKSRLQTKEGPASDAALERLDPATRLLVKSIQRGIPRQASQERVREWLAKMRGNLVKIAGLSDPEAETLSRKLEEAVTKWLGRDYYCSTYEEIASGPAKGEAEIFRAFHRISSESKDKDAPTRDIKAILTEAVGEEKAGKLFVWPDRNESPERTEDSAARGMLTGLGLPKAAVDPYAPALRETMRIEIEAGRLAWNSRGEFVGTDAAMRAIEQAAAPALAGCTTERLEQFNMVLKNLFERARREGKQLVDVVEALRGTPK
jgi:hypothetical protein